MFRTDERSLLTDLLSPPAPGYRLEHAVGTTFTLDLEALLRIPFAVVGREFDEKIDDLTILQTINSAVGRIDVFHQPGVLRTPRQPSGLFAFLEPMIHEVAPPRPGSIFHPKVWLASFVNGKERKFQFLCSSRNLTNDRSWDVVVGLTGVEKGRNRATNRELAEFITAVADSSIRPLDTDRNAPIRELISAVRRCEWDPVPGTSGDEWLRFHWMSPDRTPPAFDGADRRLIISPFLGLDGLERLVPDDAPTTLISRPESFDALDREEFQRFASERGLELLQLRNDLIDSDLADGDGAESLTPEPSSSASASASASASNLRGLHAKLIVLDRGRDSHVLIGSANATSAAWNRNSEFLVELVGSRKVFGVEAILADDAKKEGRGKPRPTDSFLYLLEEYRPSDLPNDAEDEELGRRLRYTLMDLAARPFHTEASPLADGSWAVHITSAGPLADAAIEDVTVTIRPFTETAVADSRTIDPTNPVDQRWEGLQPEQVTAFAHLSLTARETGDVVSTIVSTELVGAPDDRLVRLLAATVKDSRDFIRFIHLLLALTSDDGWIDTSSIMGRTSIDSRIAGETAASGLLEMVVLAFADSPATIDHINDLVVRLSATEDGRSKLPAGWDELWASVSAARGITGESRR